MRDVIGKRCEASCSGDTALTKASVIRHPEIVGLLLQAAAEVDKCHKREGGAALMRVCQQGRGHAETARVFLGSVNGVGFLDVGIRVCKGTGF